MILFLCGSHLAGAASPVTLNLAQIDVELPVIVIYASLLDEKGEPLEPLKIDDITLTLDGQPISVQRVVPFEQTGEGVAYTLLVDASKTMAGFPFENAVSAMTELIENIRTQDRIAIIAFGDHVTVISDFSNEKETLLNKLQAIEPDDNYTYFFNAIDKAIDLNKRRDVSLPRRRAILVITDGENDIDGQIIKMMRNFPLIWSPGMKKWNSYVCHWLRSLKASSNGCLAKSGQFKRRILFEEPGSPGFYNNLSKNFGDIHSQYFIQAEYPEGKADGSVHQVVLTYHKDEHRIVGDKKVTFFASKTAHSNSYGNTRTDSNFYPNPGTRLRVKIAISASNIYWRWYWATWNRGTSAMVDYQRQTQEIENS